MSTWKHSPLRLCGVRYGGYSSLSAVTDNDLDAKQIDIIQAYLLAFLMESVEFWPKVPAPRNRARAKVARA